MGNSTHGEIERPERRRELRLRDHVFARSRWHPNLFLKDIDWDAGLVKALPRIRAAGLVSEGR